MTSSAPLSKTTEVKLGDDGIGETRERKKLHAGGRDRRREETTW
jgi:hypothetical protein